MGLSDVEIILPGGRFASIRVPTLKDAYESGWLSFTQKNKLDALLKLTVLCSKVDGVQLTEQVFSEMPIYEANAIMEAVAKLVINNPKAGPVG